MRIAVTGKNGQVVSSLIERGKSLGVEIIGLGRPELDLLDPQSIRSSLRDVRPDIIVSAAAYTAVDKAESEEDAAFRVNAQGPGVVAEVAYECDIPVIHISTDYVFDGTKSEPYLEDDTPEPVSVYGRSKLAGEHAVARGCPNHVILRTSWVYSPFGNNFVKTMLRIAENRDNISVVADQHGTPTSALDIADAIIAVAQKVILDADPKLRGVFNLTGTGQATWADFAETIFEVLQARTGKVITVQRIRTEEYQTPARRPQNSRLSAKKLSSVYGVTLPDWKVSTGVVLDRLLS